MLAEEYKQVLILPALPQRTRARWGPTFRRSIGETVYAFPNCLGAGHPLPSLVYI